MRTLSIGRFLRLSHCQPPIVRKPDSPALRSGKDALGDLGFHAAGRGWLPAALLARGAGRPEERGAAS
jgi:hypothetical protein